MNCIICVIVLSVLLITILPHVICISLESIDNSEIAIVQYDSRALSNYWLTSAEWNHNYCKLHNHKYIYYTVKNKQKCQYNNTTMLASPWCKVKAMIEANKNYNNIKFFIYLDSDAIIDKNFIHLSMKDIIITIKNKLDWDHISKPIIFNQDGPCWWCRLIIKVGYNKCLNAGTVAWLRSDISTDILLQWWDSVLDSYDTNPIKRKFRMKWPWEQDRQMAIYNRSSDHIQITSQPNRIHMQSRAGYVNGWCLSHLPGSGCYISHHCANKHSKQVMREMYGGSSGIKLMTNIISNNHNIVGLNTAVIGNESEEGIDGGDKAEMDPSAEVNNFDINYLTFT